jgi:predicted Zn-dependent protease
MAYVQSVGKRLVPHTHRPNLPYQFAILDTSVVNAFAVPGGYVYVTRGILALMGSEAELSAVLGHELGHVNARHSVRRMSQMLIVQLGLAVSALSDTVARSRVASIECNSVPQIQPTREGRTPGHRLQPEGRL